MSDTQEFLQAVAAGDLPRVENMLRDNRLATAQNEAGTPALLLAMQRGHATVARAIAARRTHLQLYDLAALGDEEKLRAVLERSAEKVNDRVPGGFTALGLACAVGHVGVASLLLRHGADPNLAATGEQGHRPLHQAAGHIQPGVAVSLTGVLLEHGANPDAPGPGGWTALHTAAALGYRDVCALLLRNGADPAARSDGGKTPGQMAAEFGFAGVAEWLEGGP